LGFTFPKGASVLRKELYDKISAENVSAAQSSDTAEMLEAVFHSAETDNK
jgi:sRNA-binding carbon storage regulator CsrA